MYLNAFQKSVASKPPEHNLGKVDWDGDMRIIKSANLEAILYPQCHWLIYSTFMAFKFWLHTKLIIKNCCCDK